METEIPPAKPDPTPEQLAELRLKSPLTESEKEVYTARIKELEAEREQLRRDLEEARKPKPEPRKKSFLSGFNPLD